MTLYEEVRALCRCPVHKLAPRSEVPCKECYQHLMLVRRVKRRAEREGYVMGAIIALGSVAVALWLRS